MKRMTFHEYMDSRRAIKKPVVDPTGDQTDPKTMPNKPPKGGRKYKTSDGKPRTKANSAWGELGDKGLVYKPDVKNARGCKPAKLPTAEQVMMANAFVDAAAADPDVFETFVRTLRQQNMLGPLVAELFRHREATQSLAQILSSESYGPRVLKNLANAINEEVSDTYSNQLQGEEDEEHEDDAPFADEEGGQEDEGEPNADPNVPDPMMSDPNAMMQPDGMTPPAGPAGGPMMPPTPGPMMQPPQPMMQPPPQPMPAGSPMGALQQFQRAMMRAYQRAMMAKQ